MDRAIAEHQDDRWKHHVDRIFALRGEGLKAAANALRGLLELPLFTANPRAGKVNSPSVVDQRIVTAHQVVVTTANRVPCTSGEFVVDRLSCRRSAA